MALQDLLHLGHSLKANTTLSFASCSLVPRCGGGGGERALCAHALDRQEFCGDRVRTYTYVCWWRHTLMCQIVFCSGEFHITLFYAFWMLGTLEIELKKEQVASVECVYRGKILLCGYPPISVRHLFLCIRQYIKLGRACSNDVYSVQRTKAEVIFYDDLCCSHGPSIVILVHVPNSATWPLL